MISERVLAWAQRHLDRPIVAVEPIAGGLTESISAVTFATGDPAILRQLEPAVWGPEGRQHVVSEALACRLLEDSGLPVPRWIAADPDGSQTGRYVNLTTWRPGQVRLGPLNASAIADLARLAVRIHATRVPAGEHPRPYLFWAPAELRVPAGTMRPRLWQRAIDIFNAGPPPTPLGLIHRDFHPGNILWEGDTVTGVIDWTESSWGPADLDVAHCCSNLAMLHSLESADAFRASYLRQGGVLDTDPEAAAFWVIGDILGFLPEPEYIIRALVADRPDLSVQMIRDRLEHLLTLAIPSEAVPGGLGD